MCEKTLAALLFPRRTGPRAPYKKKDLTKKTKPLSLSQRLAAIENTLVKKTLENHPDCGHCHLYRHFNGEGVLLYVGISLSTVARFMEHKMNSHWCAEVRRIDIEVFTSRNSALVAEKFAIENEHPLHNITHNRRRN